MRRFAQPDNQLLWMRRFTCAIAASAFVFAQRDLLAPQPAARMPVSVLTAQVASARSCERDVPMILAACDPWACVCAGLHGGLHACACGCTGARGYRWCALRADDGDYEHDHDGDDHAHHDDDHLADDHVRMRHAALPRSLLLPGTHTTQYQVAGRINTLPSSNSNTAGL